MQKNESLVIQIFYEIDDYSKKFLKYLKANLFVVVNDREYK